MKSPRKVLHLIHGRVFSGAERALLLLCQNFDREYVEPVVVCLADGLLREKLEAIGVHVETIEMRHKLDMSVIPRLSRFVRENDIEIIHTYSGRTNLVGRIAARLTNRCTVTTVQAPIARDSNSLKYRPLNAIIDRLTSVFSEKYVTVSDDLRKSMITEGYDPQRIVTVYNGIDIKSIEEATDVADLCQEFNLQSDSFIVGTVAQFRPRKGAEYLINAIPYVVDERILFFFVGSGDWVEGRDYLVDLIRLAGQLDVLDRRAFFTGYRDDVFAFMSLFDVFILPSLFGEGTPLSILEAMALAKPVIATTTEGNREVVIDGVTGILVPAMDSIALAQAITRLKDNQDLAEQMGRRGRARVEKYYTASNMARQYEKVYRGISSDKLA